MPLAEVRRAIYTYEPAADDELAIKPDDILYILDNSDADWLQARKKPLDMDDPVEQGLVPGNHTEKVEPVSHAVALYDYEPLQDEETTLEKDEEVDILETDDLDWYMTKTKGGYGFVPRTYVEVTTATSGLNGNAPPSLPEPIHEEEETAASSIIAPSSATTPSLPPPPAPPAPPIQQPVSKSTDSPGESVRTPKSMLPPPPPPPTKQPAQPVQPSQDTISHFRVIEGKKKKGTKVNLGISNSVLIIDSGDDTVPPQRYDISDVSNCTTKKTLLVIDIGGGYLSDALEFTCGSSSEAEHIQEAVNSARRGMFIGDKPFDENHGKSTAAILPPPPPPPPKDNAPEETSKEFAVLLYDFVGQDSDELTANEGNRVLVLDKSDPEWWQIQLDPPNGQPGLVPATYLELQPAGSSGTPVRAPSIRKLSVPPPPPPPPMPEVTAIPPKTESNLHRQKTSDSDNVPLHVLQKRQAVHKASQAAADAASAYSMQLKHENQGPNMAKVRTWTDTSGAFKVEAAFLQLTPDGQVHLHKTNDKKITVPLVRFCVEDRQYVNSVTGQNGTKSVSSPQKPAKSMTARQRQQETSKKNPERRPINYDWDWFDFFTLKGGVSADNALKYATAFVADRLDNESIPEITDESMRSLGVKPADITRLNRAFRIHQGLPVSAVDTMADGYSPSPAFSPPPATQAAATARSVSVDVTSNPSMSPITSPLASGGNDNKQTTSSTANSKLAQRESASNNNPWAMDSELDRRFARQRQIETDEEYARKLQEEEKGQKAHFWKGRNRSKSKSKSSSSHSKQPSSSDPFSTLDGSGGSSKRRSTEKKPASKQPLNLGAGSRKSTAKSQTSVVDPAQLRSAQQRLGGGPTSPVHARTASRSAIDQVFGSGSSPIRSSQQQDLVSPPPPRARPTAGSAAASSNALQPSELTTSRMAAATASGNMAQINQLEQMARSKAQELAAQEAHIKQQQEEIRKQAIFLQQQQQQLLQMQQTQKVEAQLKQLKEEKERLEAQRQADEMKKQMELLKTQQANMLKMQQMANQARVQQNSGVSTAGVMSMNLSTFQQQQQPVMSSVGISTPITPMSAQPLSPQQQQQPRPTVAPLTSRLPPPLIPSQMSKPAVATSNPTRMFSTSSAQLNPPAGFANIPAASSSTTILTPGPAGIFSNQSVTGSTPNLGSFANTTPVMTSVGGGGGYGNSAAATHSVTNFTTYNTGGNNGPQQQPQFMYQQQQQLPMATSNINNNNMGSKYDLFKSVNPHAPSVFSGNMQQQSVVTSTSSSSMMNNSRPSGPTGIFAMANPTMSNPQQQLQQQQQQNNMFRPNQMMNQQQMFNNQNLQSGNTGGFGGQWH